MGREQANKGHDRIKLQVMCSKSEMKEATAFIRKNHDRIDRMLNMLADDKSRKVWKSVMLCRAKGRPLLKSLWSDHDQYFVKDIVKIGKDEVFVDVGHLLAARYSIF